MNVKAFWRCPKCRRQFPHKRQWHSCIVYPIEQHFEGKPSSLKEAFDYLIAKLQHYGPIKVDAVKTSINIAGKSHFAAVYVLKNSMNLEFVLDRDLKDARIFRSQKPGKAMYIHWVKLAGWEDIDARLLRWLKRGYQLKS